MKPGIKFNVAVLVFFTMAIVTCNFAWGNARFTSLAPSSISGEKAMLQEDHSTDHTVGQEKRSDLFVFLAEELIEEENKRNRYLKNLACSYFDCKSRGLCNIELKAENSPRPYLKNNTLPRPPLYELYHCWKAFWNDLN